MHVSKPSLFARDDTFLGICEAVGEDFGFNPLPLRIAFGVLLLWNPVAVIGAYFGLGVIVLASRFLFPNPRVAARPATIQADVIEEEEAVPEPLAEAA